MSVSRIWGVLLRYLYVTRKGLHQLTELFYWPLVDILLWGLTSIWIYSQNDIANLPIVLMTALIFWQICWRGSVDISVNVLQEFWHRNLVNLFSTPLKFSEWVVGMLILGISKLIITIAFGATVVFLFYSINVFIVGWMFVPFAILLVLFGWTVSFLSASAIIYWGQRVEVFAWMAGFLFAPFSAVFYPVEILPGWARSVAWCLPTTYVFEGMRCILDGQQCPYSFLVSSASLNILYLCLAIALFYWAFQRSCNKGLARFV